MNRKQILTSSKDSLIEELKNMSVKKEKQNKDKSNLVKGLAMIIASIDYLDEKDIKSLTTAVKKLNFIKQYK